LPYILKAATKNGPEDYDAIAVTTGPGLIGSLLIGVTAAKSLAMARDIPIFSINHLEGHIYSAWLNEKTPELPALILIASGGHTELIYMSKHLYYQHLGSTRDDATGEAFDKVARLLDLPYPGGPAIGALAPHGDPDAYQLPIGLPERDSLEFSFSGLKAAVFHLTQKLPSPMPAHIKADVAASFQKTIADTLKKKMLAALGQYPDVATVCFVGGVAANKYLRVELEKAVNEKHNLVSFVTAPMEYSTDNAAMIGAAACFHQLFGHPDAWYDIEANPNLDLTYR
jgi:N6-L-threonylcarbamoyladenine synthase